MIGPIVATAAIVAAAQQTRVLPSPQNEALVARSAYSTVFGPTGLIAVPTAATVAQDELVIGVTMGDNFSNLSGNWGITRDIEVGATYFNPDGGDDKLIGNAKVMIVPSNFRNFTIGIGIIDAFDAFSSDPSIYVMGSAWLTPGRTLQRNDAIGLRVHAGVGTGMFDEELIGGAEVIVNNNWAIVGEWDSNNVNGAIRYVHDDSFRAQMGFFNKDLFFGISYGLRF